MKINYMENKDIILPYELALKGLTLEEIGAVIVLFAIQRMTDDEKKKWSSSDDYLEAINGLINKRIVKVSYNENDNMNIDIDLTDKEPEPFWELEDYDNNDNPIYSHPSYLGEEEGSPFYFRIKPILNDLKVVWVDCSDEDLFTYKYEHYGSLEEAEEAYKELLQEQLEYIKKLK